MNRRHFLFLLASTPAAARTALQPEMEEIRGRFKVPAVGAMAFNAGSILAAGVAGERRRGSGTPATLDDKFHVGSITKSMTAMLAGMLVEEGRLKWETSLGEALRGFRMHPGVRDVTLSQLLRHRSGVQRDIPDGLFETLRLSRLPPHQQRERLARELLPRPPRRPPEQEYEYSNLGYTLAGVMIERTARQPWEELMRRRLFRPLGLESAGFGAPAKDPEKLDQPWGHVASGRPVQPGPQADNVPAIGPAGTVHMSLPDLARYGQFHLQESAPVRPPILKPETLRHLHGAGNPDGYELGWERHTRPWAGRQAIYHNGSNTMFYAVLWLAAERDFGVLAAANQGGDEAEAACDAAASLLVQRWAPR